MDTTTALTHYLQQLQANGRSPHTLAQVRRHGISLTTWLASQHNTDDVAQVTGKLRRGEGSLGRLIQDDVMFNDLRESLKALRQGAGDVRENAPILAFAGFLFGGF